MRRNLLFSNPAEFVERFKLPKRALPEFMTTEELSAFFAACSPWERRMFSILFLSGMRRGELLYLEWSDVRFDLSLILIRAKAEWRPKTDERVIPMTPTLEEVLREEGRHGRSPRWVCANRAGNQETHLLPKLKKVCRKAGITPSAQTLHALRHSFGSHLRMAGVPLANRPHGIPRPRHDADLRQGGNPNWLGGRESPAPDLASPLDGEDWEINPS